MSDGTIAVADLLAREAIREVLMRYSRGVDRLDRDLLRDCFHDESVDDHGHFKGSGHEFADFIVGSLAERAHHTSHTVANVLIQIDDLDAGVAHAESYGIAYLRRTEDDVEWLDLFAGRYVDRFERRGGHWRIADRTVVHDWSLSLELDPASSFPLVIDGFVQGSRDHSDPAYLR
jgi:SnoaL-like domain